MDKFKLIIEIMYPDDWKDIATEIKQRCLRRAAPTQWCCQKCGLQCAKPGEKIKSRVYMLQVHHWNRNPADNRRENLIALCGACHLNYHRGGKSNISPGQLSLFDS